MIPVQPAQEPSGFDERVRQRGNAWLATNPGAKEPPPYWREFGEELAEAFEHLCAYSAMLDFSGTVDHFLPRETHQHLTYEWSNYRYATHWVNSGKRSRVFLDPFVIQEGWFEVQLPSMLLVMTAKMPPDVQARISGEMGMLRWLNGEKFKGLRSRWYETYKSGDLSLESLRRFAPLIAVAVEKQGLAASKP